MQASLWEGTVPALCWVELSLVPLGGRSMSRGAFWGSCELSKTLGSLSVDGCCCVPVLLLVWPEEFRHWSLRFLGGDGSCCQNGDIQESSHQLIFPGVSATCVLAPTFSYSQPLPPQETLQEPT